MKKILLLTSLTAFIALTASAGPVSFNTTGVFSCNAVASCVASSNGGTNNVVTVNGISVTYNSTINTLTAPTFTDFGTLTSACTNAGCSASPSNLIGVTLLLTITQTVPSAGSGSFGTATLAGTITGAGQSSAQINFSASNTTSQLCPQSCPGVYINPGPGQVLYQITNGSKSIVPPTSGNLPGLTTLQGAVTDSPEPVSMSLVGIGLVALASARRWKRA